MHISIRSKDGVGCAHVKLSPVLSFCILSYQRRAEQAKVDRVFVPSQSRQVAILHIRERKMRML